MSKDSQQLSVAELLARNGQQGATPGGGRRRRAGRGVSVTELTGDLPAIPTGGRRSAHSAPEDPDADAGGEPAEVEQPDHSPPSGPSDPLAGGRSRHGAPEADATPPRFDVAALASGTRGGRRRRPDPDDADEVPPPAVSNTDPMARWAPPPPSRWAGEEPANAPSAPTGIPEPDSRPPLPRRSGGFAANLRRKVELPAWSARRHHRPDPPPAEPGPNTGGLPTAAWSLASQDQQLLSGQSVAGELLRHEADQQAPASEFTPADNNRTDVYGPMLPPSAPRRPGPPPGRAQAPAPPPRPGEVPPWDTDQGFDDLDEEYDEFDPESEEYDEEAESDSLKSRVARRARAVARRPQWMDSVAGTVSAARARRFRTDSVEEADSDDSVDERNRRQWLILGGQTAGAAIGGMLMFKGFQRMWETMPWLALSLAVVVILGLVALVRILRRGDDIFSTVIAVGVGAFVTLGPLAFLLSTN